MKIIMLLLLSSLININVFATSYEVKIVNNKHITNYELANRTKLLLLMNNIESPSEEMLQDYRKKALKSLTYDQIMLDYALEVRKDISEEEISEMIENIEKNNNNPKGSLVSHLKKYNVESSFRNQIRSELIKGLIVRRIASSESITHKELNNAILLADLKEAEINIQIFTSRDSKEITKRNMENLRKNLSTCEGIKPKDYQNFATLEKIHTNIRSLSAEKKNIVKDLSPNNASKIIKAGDKYEIIQLCNKTIMNFSNEENKYVTSLLINKKIMQKVEEFIQNLYRKAYMKDLINI